MSIVKSRKSDPRTAISADAFDNADASPLSPVAMPTGWSPGMKLGAAGIAMLGILTFTTLTSSRGEATKSVPEGKPTVAAITKAPPGGFVPQRTLVPGPPELPAPKLIPPAKKTNSSLGRSMGVIGPMAIGTGMPPVSLIKPNYLQAPGVVFDLTKGAIAAAVPVAAVTPGMEAAAAKDGMTGNPNDVFADRVSGAENEPARATRIANSSYTVPEGAIIAATLETAINSDLPGYVRAVVTRDVMGFDGRRTLIPSGSRLIGQYKSGLTAGQSRAFIVWTRLTRPDGVTVSLGSPATDPLGRAGLGGKVDTHFFKRFGSAILLSVVQSGVGALQRNNSDIVVRSADDAKSAAGIALQSDINIPPTVKVAQGSPVRIFLARDLDFSGTDGGF